MIVVLLFILTKRITNIKNEAVFADLQSRYNELSNWLDGYRKYLNGVAKIQGNNFRVQDFFDIESYKEEKIAYYYYVDVKNPKLYLENEVRYLNSLAHLENLTNSDPKSYLSRLRIDKIGNISHL